MTVFAVRVFLFSILPLLLSAGILLFDRSYTTRDRRLEVPLIMLFGLGVAGSGIASFFGHYFFADVVAESIGWPSGSPFQLEMAFANLAVGILGLIAAGRRDGFREATVIAVTVLGVGASIVHFQDILATGNMAPGNTIQNIANLIKPAFLIPLLAASRIAERSGSSDAGTAEFELWRAPLLQAVPIVTVVVAAAFAVGFAVGNPVVVSGLGTMIAVAALAVILARSSAHTTPASRQ
jgi:hypothetical protein